METGLRVLDGSAWAAEHDELEPRRSDAKHEACMAARFDDATRERLRVLDRDAAWPWDERGGAAMLEVNRIWDECGSCSWEPAAVEPDVEPAANDSPVIQEHVGTWTPAPPSAPPNERRRQPKRTRRSWPRKVVDAARRLGPRVLVEIERCQEAGIGRTAVRDFAAGVLKAKARAHDVADATLERLTKAGTVVRQQVGRLVKFVASLFVAGAAERASPAARHEQEAAECSAGGRPDGRARGGASGPENAGIGTRCASTSPRAQGRPRTGRCRRPPPVTFGGSFWKKLEPANARASGCSEWLGSFDDDGYGRVGQHGRAHRLAFEIHYGVRLPSELHVLHRCDNRACCEPRHMSIGTHADNMADRKAKGRY